jgi:hypothetical protein
MTCHIQQENTIIPVFLFKVQENLAKKRLVRIRHVIDISEEHGCLYDLVFGPWNFDRFLPDCNPAHHRKQYIVFMFTVVRTSDQ